MDGQAGNQRFTLVRRHSRFLLGDTVAEYLVDGRSGAMELRLYPRSASALLVRKRRWVDDDPGLAAFPAQYRRIAASHLDSLAHCRLRGEAQPGGFSQGLSLRATSPEVKFLRQEVKRSRGGLAIITTLAKGAGVRISHRLSWRNGDRYVEVTTGYRNRSAKLVTLDLATSFSLGGLTPFHRGDAPGRLWIHRFRSYWSAEGRHERVSAESLHLERSWASNAVHSERFGQVGTMPVRGFAPFVGVEDSGAGVFWGAMLACGGSWQMECWRRDDNLCVSGGLADREFGHWGKELQPGEEFSTPPALLAASHASLDDLCERLLPYQERETFKPSPAETALPIVFNEYCTTWGNPAHDHVLRLARAARDAGAEIFVIDAGWYKQPGVSWQAGHGDWIDSPEFFPHGIGATARAIRELGLIPGLWFEIETCGEKSQAFSEVGRLLHRDGEVLTVGCRRFWNLCDPEVLEYLGDRVIGLLREAGFGYVKIDYNETLGIGCDGAESPGEGLRRQVAAMQDFIRRIRRELPGIIIENCASGGHRLEPSFMSLADMGSFSDAHTGLEIPIIAANLQRLVPPYKSQIWAVYDPKDHHRHILYKIAAGFLGRLCLSGPLDRADASARNLFARCRDLYRRAAPVIRSGISRRYGPDVKCYRHPEGWQAMVRTSRETAGALIVFHAFGNARKHPAGVPCPAGAGITDAVYSGEPPTMKDGQLIWRPSGDFDAAVVFCQSENR